MTPFQVSAVRFASADTRAAARGVVGYVTVTLDGALELDGLVLLRDPSGSLSIAVPSRADRKGQRHPYVRLRDPEARQRIEAQVLHALAVQGVRE